MNKFEFELLLDECISALEDGKSLDELLSRYPDQKEKLLPLLQAAEKCQSYSIPLPSDTAFQEGQSRLLAETALLSSQGHFSKNGTKAVFSRYAERWKHFIGKLLLGKELVDMKLAPRLALYSLVTILVAGFFTVTASASSLPGDNLYGLKLGWEKTRLALTFNDDARQELEHEFEEERLEEVDELISEGRQAEIEFYGSIQEKGDSFWIISGFSVEINQETELSGSLNIGDWVKVEGISLGNGTLLAWEIDGEDLDDDMDGDMDDDLDDDMDDDLDDDLDDDMDDDMDDDLDDDRSYDPEIIEFTGMVEEMVAGYLMVSGTQVYIDYETDIEDEVEVGSYVDVEAAVRADGSLLAIDVDLDDDAHENSDYSPEIIEFTGMVEELMADYLVVSGTLVYIDFETDIEDEVEVGSHVEVEAAVREDGSLLAIDVDLDDDAYGDSDYSAEIIKFLGEVETITDDYLIVDGRMVYTDFETDIEEDVEIGSYVEVEAAVQADGSLLAIDVDLKDPS